MSKKLVSRYRSTYQPVRVSFVVDATVIERARDACYARRKRLSPLVESLLLRACAELEAENGGRPFPPRPGPLPAGRATTWLNSRQEDAMT
jgi:hypothetical protein